MGVGGLGRDPQEAGDLPLPPEQVKGGLAAGGLEQVRGVLDGRPQVPGRLVDVETQGRNQGQRLPDVRVLGGRGQQRI